MIARRNVIFTIGAIAMGFFSRDADADSDTTSGIHIHDTPNDPPRNERIYTARLDNRASIKITMKTAYGSLMKSGELTQPNGRWVLFDPDAIADKILDPLLVPLVQNRVDEIFLLDEPFRKSVMEFVDTDRKKWRLVSGA